ncbi:MAG TPA: membrane protein insertion efficiency factor YidD [Elusimicrobiota bacterium]|nr:membrane protein insertion efficiency factor YidD [Elusimicrobiota bacterium]
MEHVLQTSLLFAVRAYWGVSSLFRPRCRFWPTCSHYLHDAVLIHGSLLGLRLGFRRLLRCHPFGGSGFDPVPEKVAHV